MLIGRVGENYNIIDINEHKVPEISGEDILHLVLKKPRRGG
jgi:hypothetical protein